MGFVLEEDKKIKISVYGKVLPSEEIGEDDFIPARLALTENEIVLYKFREDYFEEKEGAKDVVVKLYQRWALADIAEKHIKMPRVSMFSKKIFIAIYTEFEKVSVVCEKDEYKACKEFKRAIKNIPNFKFF